MAIAVKKSETQISRYLTQPYARELVKNEDGTWFARVVEFAGCMTEGDTAEDAIANLDDAMAAWLRVALEDGDPVPEPLSGDRFSGKFLVRVPRSLHRELARRSELEGVSLNQYILSVLSRAVGL